MFFSNSISLFVVSFSLLFPAAFVEPVDTCASAVDNHAAFNIKYSEEIKVVPAKVIQQFAVFGDGKTRAIFKSDISQQKWTYAIIGK